MTLDDETIPLLLRVTRARHKHTQAQAAELMGVNPQTVWRWEAGTNLDEFTITLGSLRAISSYTGLPLEEVAAKIPVTKERSGNATA